MSIELTTDPELRAKKAEELTAFGGLNLVYIKRSVAQLLGQIGREGIFDQYTKHDISHIDEMLKNLEWIIPEQTKKVMSDADWLMIVLAVYFHDMGMLVTKDEFKARTKPESGFTNFCEEMLFAGPSGPDYKAKVAKLPDDEKDRFLYQEFVRSKHAERIRVWIMGQTKDQLGIATNVIEEVSKLLEPLGLQFRRDLGIVCESHHLNDLNDVQKYKVAQPYGNSDAATVNLQYSAVLLRTADLLHITSDRTPSIEFRTINPNDPLSQQEWAKQRAVTRVKEKWGVNEEGHLDENAPRDIVEVHAFFTQEDGFFGLTSYLAYAADQLKKSSEWISQSVKQRLAKHEFPWRRIDDTNIETEGFIRDAFEFTIDQGKILDLLTGHTLYNDTNIVLRELVQNAIDAIRLKFFPKSPLETGRVTISWDSKAKVLSVQDNGTGMTQEIINNFLLKVGSSQYQDQEFIKKNPGFSSISRFGIGVLSTFMIADSVEVVTCHPEEEQARRLMLRSVHGKYLIRLLEKGSGDPQVIGSHGTIFRLYLRPSVRISDVMQNAQNWIVVPDCIVTVQIDDSKPQRVGYVSPAEALRGYLKSSGLDYCEEGGEDDLESNKRKIRIVELHQDSVTMAYALMWNKWFKEWSFLPTSLLPNIEDGQNEGRPPLLGTCVEGIRIVDDSPGFKGHPIVALANVRGQSAPKTNVARSGLEMTPERDAMLRIVYALYAQHISGEIADLTASRSFSITWAAGETAYLLLPLLRHDREQPLNPKLLWDALRAIPCVLVEEAGKRIITSPQKMSDWNSLWTIDCVLLSSAESLIREVASAASLSKLVNALNVTDFKFPNDPVVCGININNELVQTVFESREVDKIIVNQEQRRVDLHWVKKTSPPRWIHLPENFKALSGSVYRTSSGDYAGFHGSHILNKVPIDGVVVDVPSDEIALIAFEEIYLVPGTEITVFARQCIEDLHRDPSNDLGLVAIAVLGIIGDHIESNQAPIDVESVRKSIGSFDRLGKMMHISKHIELLFDFSEFAFLLMKTNWKTYNPSVWRRTFG